MGVQGLWTLVAPAARPVKLETLRDRKLAVDASIWIHQFLRSMRDKEGNALRNGYILGFFRRLCKLLFYNIKPVFVFDGGAPALKRSTITERRRRRQDMVVNLKRTAEKILSAQVKSKLLMEEEKKRLGLEQPKDEDFVYLEELENTAALNELRRKRKRDQFELPTAPSIDDRNQTDPRLATKDELQSFVDDFKPTDMNIDSDTFQSLPPEIQYEIIQDIKLKSRQTSWARLDEMVRSSRTALDFSKQQIKQLAHRNDMTQRLMQMNETASKSTNAPTRIASERGREYILVKNDNLEQGLGWRLPGVVSTTKQNAKPNTTQESAISKESPEPVDKVSNAIASNPKLAALISGYLTDDEEYEHANIEEQVEDTAEVINEEYFSENSNDDEPLFSQPSDDRLINDIRAYTYEDEDEDDAINQVIAKIYSENSVTDTQETPKETSELLLPANDFHQLWLSRVPDAFVYLNSLNDKYKQILTDAIFSQDSAMLETQLKSVQKTFGKTSDRDELAQESLAFHERFLKSTLQWKEVHAETILESDDNVLRKDIPFIEEDDQEIVFEQKDSPTVPTQEDQLGEDIAYSGDIDLAASISKSSLRPPPQDIADIDSSAGVAMESEEDLESAVENIPVFDYEDDVQENTISSKSSDDKEDARVENLQADESVHPEKNAPIIESPIKILEPTRIETKEENPTDETSDIELLADPEMTSEVPQQHMGYNSDEELLEGAEAEENEYVRFVSDIASKDIQSVRQELDKDMAALNEQHLKAMRNSEDITQQMIQDIQELLKLFGIPFVVSPMEAEAQCAELMRLGLIEGVVTDDSDVFLFGATRIYKNMFNQQRYVECYLLQDVEHDMKLSRQKLIQLAFLLGSDYTEGIPGVGPVAAMEILAEFSSDEDETLEAPLKAFQEWYNLGEDHTEFQRKFRKKHKHLDIPNDFPSTVVKDAYYQPRVDTSQQPFVWGTPQLDSLRIYLMECFAWPEEKADEVLIPVIREMNKRSAEKQTSIGNYFDFSGESMAKNAPRQRRTHHSKRVQSVINRWRGEEERERENGKEEETTQKGRQGRKKRK